MSTTSRGSAFEERVYDWVARELAQGRLGLAPEMCRLHRGKGYHSRDRGDDITVDISIEVWQVEAETWSLLWVYECKDHSGSVPVGKVEEFKAKLDQISSANRKGVFVATGALQDGALKYARAHGIAVLHMPTDGPVAQVCHVVGDYRKTVLLGLQEIARVNANRRVLLKRARRITRDLSAAEDIVQDVLKSLLSGIPKGTRSIDGYVLHQTKSSARAWLSRKKKEKAALLKFERLCEVWIEREEAQLAGDEKDGVLTVRRRMSRARLCLAA